jgi:SAM-dependent methyltransferase
MFVAGEAYERLMGRWSRPLAGLFVTFVSLADGDAVLDVGCGTGAITSAVAASRPSARITGVDPSATFVAHAHERARGRIRFVVGDGRQLPLMASAFDGTLSLLVLNFIPDRERAVREMIRVTRPRGTVAAAVWDYGDGMQMLRLFWDEAVARDPSIAARDERNMPLCRRGELAGLWRAQGLEAVDEQPLTVDMRFESFDDYWLPFLEGQGPSGAYAASLSTSDRTDLEERLRRRLHVSAHGGPIVLQARAWAVKGVVL